MKILNHSFTGIGVILIFIICSITNDYSLFFFPVFFFLVFTFFLNKENLYYYRLSLLFNIVLGSLLCIENLFTGGELYKIGLDANVFYDSSLALSKLTLNNLFQVPRMGGYYFVVGFLYRFLEFVGINSVSYFHSLSFNFAIGAFIPVITNKIGTHLGIDKKLVRKAVMLIIFLPLINYYSAVGIRDVWINLLFLLFVYQYFRFKSKNWSSLIFIILILVFTYLVRSHNALFFVIFIYIDQAIIILKSHHKKVFILVSLLVFPILVILFDDYFLKFYNSYYFISINENDKNSIGLFLKNDSGIVGKLTYILQYIIGPFPPRIVKEITFDSIYISMGTLIGYIIMPVYFFLLLKNKVSSVIKSYSIYFIGIMCVIAIITAHFRHKIFLYPLILVFLTYLFENSDKRSVLRFLKYEVIVYLILTLIYFYIKSNY